ncbi:MAG: WhiB family transcriptional regulator [Actinomycetota bacterium]|nr:WhiB family transcriptional regulator [Actinomycetota bacterium]
MIAKRGEELWQARAACRGPHAGIFFPPSHIERKEERLTRERTAKAICHSCPVEDECLEYAVRIREAHGIWGGRNETERKQIIDRLPASPGLRMHA